MLHERSRVSLEHFWTLRSQAWIETKKNGKRGAQCVATLTVCFWEVVYVRTSTGKRRVNDWRGEKIY